MTQHAKIPKAAALVFLSLCAEPASAGFFDSVFGSTPCASTPNGIEVSYWREGVKRFETTCKRGVQDGPVARWYSNGKREFQGTMLDGKKHGVWYEWHKDGRAKAIIHFDRGFLHGHFEQWFPSGQKDVDCSYVDDREHGFCAHWNEDGSRLGIAEYDHGQLHGRMIAWRGIGLSSVGDFRAGQLTNSLGVSNLDPKTISLIDYMDSMKNKSDFIPTP